MPYKTYSEVIAEQIEFLHSQDLDVEELQIDTEKFVPCRKLGCTEGRGELCYKTTSKNLDNGCLRLSTWCRGSYGEKIFSNYGLPQKEGEILPIIEKPKVSLEVSSKNDEEGARKSADFWKFSSLYGISDYLKCKGVGAYGLRFRGNKYGRVAVVPMVDEKGKLWSCQMLNPDKKLFLKDTTTKGLFHCLAPLQNGTPFGIAESYVTAATCYELTGISTVCAFYSGNLVSVAEKLRLKYPDSSMIIFADNDRHLPKNEGVLKAQKACDAITGHKILAAPDFGGMESSKDSTDWNDLVRLRGCEVVKTQLERLLTVYR